MQIMDINDNDPVIAGADTVEIDVIEHSPIGSILAVFSATDADFGDFAAIEFSITSGDTCKSSCIGSCLQLLYVSLIKLTFFTQLYLLLLLMESSP